MSCCSTMRNRNVTSIRDRCHVVPRNSEGRPESEWVPSLGWSPMREQWDGQVDGPAPMPTRRFSKPVEQRRREVFLGLAVVGVLGAAAVVAFATAGGSGEPTAIATADAPAEVLNDINAAIDASEEPKPLPPATNPSSNSSTSNSPDSPTPTPPRWTNPKRRLERTVAAPSVRCRCGSVRAATGWSASRTHSPTPASSTARPTASSARPRSTR